MKKGRKRTLVILAVLVVAVAGVWLLTRGSGQVQYSEETASTGTLTTYYNFSGKIEVDRSTALVAPGEATVKEIYVEPNDIVGKDARLMRLSDGSIIKADLAGEVTSLEVRVDEKVGAGDLLAEILDMDSLKVTFKVDEYDISSVQIGKTAEVTLDGTGDTFEGPITHLNKKATESGDLSYYTATISLTGVALPEDVLPGMQVNVRLLNAQAQDVVTLKMDALSFTAANEAYVLMRDGNSVKQVPVEVGISDGAYVEIKSGLRGGDTVLYLPTTQQTFPMMGGRM